MQKPSFFQNSNYSYRLNNFHWLRYSRRFPIGQLLESVIIGYIYTRYSLTLFIRLLPSNTNIPEAKLSSTFLSPVFWKYSKTLQQQPKNIQRLFRLQNCLSCKSTTMSRKYSKTLRPATSSYQQQQPAATSSSNQQQQPAAATSSSNQQQQSAAATSSINQQQQPAAATSSSNQQQQPAATINSSNQQQQPAASNRIHTIHDDLR